MPILLTAFCMLLAVDASAASIKAVSLTPAKDGDVVRIVSDAAMEYQVFELDGPPRLVLNFPDARLARGVEPVRSDSPAVNSVFPVASKEGVRLEIGMGRKLGYKVTEQGKTLVVKFEALPDTAATAAEAAARLQDIVVRDRGSMTELVLRGEHMDASHNAFITNQGRTMILDFWGAESKLPKEHYAFSTQKVSGVTIGKAEGRVRLVIDLVPTTAGTNVKHQIDASSGQLVVRFGKVAPKRRAAAVVVEDVVFQPDDRIAHLVIRTDAANPIVNLSEKDDHVVIDVRKAVLATGQERSQDVSAFPGPVRQVDSYMVNDNVRIVARLRDKVAVSSYQHGNVLTVNLEPEDLVRARMGAAGGEEEFAYTGQKVTFDFKDIDIRNALKLISEMSNLNIIMADDVTGTLTMRLVDVPWDQALDLILAARGLGKDQTGNVLRIAPIEVLRDEYKSKLEAQQGSEKLEPLITEFITLSFTRVEDVEKMFKKSATVSEGTAGGSTSGGTGGTEIASGTLKKGFGLLSPRGSFMIDERTNTLIIKDTEKSVTNIKRLIAVIDKPVEQVLIEARIVEATDDFTRELGVRWGGVAQSNSPNFTAGGAQGAGNPLDSGNPNTTTAGRGFLVDLPAAVGAGTGGAIGLSYGILGGAVQLDLELSAAEAENKVKIVSNPRVVTTNLKTAVIEQGTDIPFQSTSANLGTNVQFKRATLGLNVTPQITADDRVILHVVVTKDSPSAALVGQNPIISTKTIDTEIFMDNGETVVIGGIYSRDRTNKVNGVPLLKDIPLLGWLFKTKLLEDKRQELLIFMTPTVIKNKTAISAGQTKRL